MNAQAVFVGERYGRWTIIAEAGRARNRARRFECQCDCGAVSRVEASDLKSGHSRSCGCLRREMTAERSTTHGRTRGGKRSAEFTAWRDMIRRCTNPKASNYQHYGGRGIRVCQRWIDSFEAFLIDVGERPGPGYSLDRKENDGDYEPGNVRWATKSEQRRNTRDAVIVHFRGVAMPLADACEIAGVAYKVAHSRLRRLGWPVERALSAAGGAT